MVRPAPPPIEITLPPSLAAQPHRVTRVRRKQKSRPPAEPLMVKLITDDPNVVIYWIAN
jgi:hypothetical protein